MLPVRVCRVGAVMLVWALGAVQVGAFAQTTPLTIDSVLLYSTYLGGKGLDQGAGIAVDTNGNIIVAGTTDGGFPTEGSLQSSDAGVQDVFVAKVDRSNVTALDLPDLVVRLDRIKFDTRFGWCQSCVYVHDSEYWNDGHSEPVSRHVAPV